MKITKNVLKQIIMEELQQEADGEKNHQGAVPPRNSNPNSTVPDNVVSALAIISDYALNSNNRELKAIVSNLTQILKY